MAPSMLGNKLGMTRVYVEAGRVVPVPVIELGPCVVTQLRSPERVGFSAVQIGFEEKPARNAT
ncbi:MAG: 50S ribosomal protein L3, partial [Phycisphaerales bacterium JB058]